jgi:hypothetical protein
MLDKARMRGIYGGLFLTALSALMLEILLTRIFSVSTWYYFAFFAISVAMFGLTVGALIVYLFKDYFPDDLLPERLSLAAVLMAVSVDLALMVFLSLPFDPRLTGVGIFSTVFVYLVIALPFICAGVVFCLCITRFASEITRIYAYDLTGAAVGAFLVFPVLNAMDAPSAVFLVGAASALASLVFARASSEGAKGVNYKISAIAFIVLAAFTLVNATMGAVRVEWVKGKRNNPENELWNTFSRIAVYPLKFTTKPYSWGLSPAYVPKYVTAEHMIDIDGVSETVMTAFNGDFNDVEHLKYDVTAFAHYLKDDAKVFVIGVGGGRDILTAKVFGQKEVVGAEINNRILEMSTDVYGDFSGRVIKLPGVRVINDEARSAITRMDEKFDIIQASCIATWSATSAGAFSLAENSLYTVEGWRTFFDRLNPDGVLSFNRWYFPDYPAQLLRMASIASYVLRERGVEDPARHIMVVRTPLAAKFKDGRVESDFPSGTIIVSKSPFSDESIGRMREATAKLKFAVEFDPKGPRNALFEDVIKNASNPDFHARTELDLTPPTDDRPFFFFMLRLKDVFNAGDLKFQEQSFTLDGMIMLFVLLGVSVVLSALFIAVPLVIVRKKVPLPTGSALTGLGFFGAIGLAYILVEIGELQRLIIFLGHPVYSITVVLFSMLFASGIGSAVSGRLQGLGCNTSRLGRGRIIITMALLVALLIVVIFAQPRVLAAYEFGTISTRIFVSLIFLLPLGFIMGLPFPMGMRLAATQNPLHSPWFWAINGAMSVVASVLSVCISISLGFTATLIVGLLFYVLASFFLLVLDSGAGQN